MAKGNSSSKQNAREKAAAAREAQLAQEKRKERMTRILIAVVCVVAVVGIIGGAVVYSNNNKAASGAVGPDPSHALPKTVSSETYALPFKADPKAGVPLVQIWEDPQCPACAQFEGTAGPILEAAAQANTINLEYRPTTFLDPKIGNDSSSRAISAWGCAVDEGKGNQFHNTMFQNQPTEGAGYTQQVLIGFGQSVGIEGADFTKFETCVNNLTYTGWAANSTEKFQQDGIEGTPTVVVNGKVLSTEGVTPANIIEKIQEAAKSS